MPILYTKEEIDNVIIAYQNGDLSSKIVKDFGMSESYVHHILRKNKIPKQIHKGNWNQKYHLNESFFEEINTPEKAYWLGWFYSDGSVHQKNNRHAILLRLQSKDKYIIQNFIERIESNYPLVEDFKKKQHGVFIYNKKMCQDLIDQGCIENKSLILKWPQNVPDHLLPYFLRGVFEGDGTVSTLRQKTNGKIRTSCRIACSRFFSDSLSIYLSSNDIKNAVYKQDNIDIVYIGGEQQCCKFYHLIYSGDLTNMLLYRKYQRFLDIIDHSRSKDYQI